MAVRVGRAKFVKLFQAITENAEASPSDIMASEKGLEGYS